jgi:hypothetical protein
MLSGEVYTAAQTSMKLPPPLPPTICHSLLNLNGCLVKCLLFAYAVVFRNKLIPPPLLILVDNLGRAVGQINQLQVFSHLKVRLLILVDNLGRAVGQINQPQVFSHLKVRLLILVDNLGRVEGQINQFQVFSQLKIVLIIPVDYVGGVEGQISKIQVFNEMKVRLLILVDNVGHIELGQISRCDFDRDGHSVPPTFFVPYRLP